MSVRTGFLSSLLLLLWMSGTLPARADLKVCNDTDELVGLAIGYKEKSEWVTEGWWRVPAETCATVIEGDLEARFFYLHAEGASGRERWMGKVFLCTSSKEFRVVGPKDCFARGYEKTGFFEVDTGEQKNWQGRLANTSKPKLTASPSTAEPPATPSEN